VRRATEPPHHSFEELAGEESAGKAARRQERWFFLEIEFAVEQAVTREDVESAIKTRGADVYARFLLRHIRPDMAVLDCGCGEGTITLGLAEAVPEGRVVGLDLKQRELVAARRSAAALRLNNLSWTAADGRRMPFCNEEFDAFSATLCLRQWTILRRS
jgi:tRNA G46 methylase TrmB